MYKQNDKNTIFLIITKNNVDNRKLMCYLINKIK